MGCGKCYGESVGFARKNEVRTRVRNNVFDKLAQ